MLRWELWPSNLPVGESMMTNATAGDFISPEGGNVAGQSLSCLTLCDPINCSTPGFPVLHHPPGFSQTHVHWVGDAIQTSHSLSSLSSPALNFLSTRVFSNLVLCIRKPKYWNFSFSISPSKECSELTSFRMDWFDPLAVQRTLKRLLQHCIWEHPPVKNLPARRRGFNPWVEKILWRRKWQPIPVFSPGEFHG